MADRPSITDAKAGQGSQGRRVELLRLGLHGHRIGIQRGAAGTEDRQALVIPQQGIGGGPRRARRDGVECLLGTAAHGQMHPLPQHLPALGCHAGRRIGRRLRRQVASRLALRLLAHGGTRPSAPRPAAP
jgi:hypothetical protein